MKQFHHKDYDQYREAQIATNRKKSTDIWIQPSELEIVATAITDNLHRQPHFGICHGVRTGTENKALSRLLNAEVIGTDLVGRDNVRKMDFHDEAPQWTGKADFVYSNSLDHSYDPDLALQRWIQCLRPDGILLIHWDPGDEIPKPSAADCFRASANEYRTMLTKYGSLKEQTSQRYRPKKKQSIEITLFILTQINQCGPKKS